MKNKLKFILPIIIIVALTAYLGWQVFGPGPEESSIVTTESEIVPTRLAQSDLNTNFQINDIPLNEILSGGPGKNGIPALTDPEFISIAESEISDDITVIFVENEGEQKIYPYSILVWHEIVNDEVGGKPLAVTFCPLCGSAIVFDREVDGETLEFGVSGFLYESNLLMYDKGFDESLWSQSLGRAVVGTKTGESLEYFPLQLMTYKEARERFPDALVLSENTGYSRDYNSNPYFDYEKDDNTLFPVSVDDNRYPAKEVFYIVPLEGNSVAVRLNLEDGDYQVPDSDVVIKVQFGDIKAFWGDAEIPGYFEMWFSWATHNQDTGTVID